MSNMPDTEIKNFIFDLYGTLVDIKTDERKASLWQKMAMIFSMLSAEYPAKELKGRFFELEKAARNAKLSKLREEYNDNNIQLNEIEIKLEYVFQKLFTEKGVSIDLHEINQLMVTFRALSTSHIRLYDEAKGVLCKLAEANKKIYLLSNAQRMFTDPEVKMLGTHDCFDGIMYSSDIDFQKPSHYFFDALFQNYGLKKEESVMIGNEYNADILGADAYGIKSMYIHTAQSGERQKKLPESCQEIKQLSEILNFI